MSQVDITIGLPENYEQLKTSSNRSSNWRERLSAVEELGKWEHAKIMDILNHRMNNDLVYAVQEAAYRQLQLLGESPQKPARRKGELFKGVNKVLLRVKKSLPAGHSYEEFKDKLKRMREDIYDTYEGDKGDEFDAWLQGVWSSLGSK
ncbi:HEAT repeat domain-containing protein [Paenibacillus aurantiacus]|uniref:HEAT repeat domain-containing protein n=1 Tax=Paenibacillus aurantiacus TaxID=1936118 RepID=A0ABV5KII1_9BACL